MRDWKHLFVLSIFALCALLTAYAQENADITGTITDQSGAAVAGVTVTITDTATGATRSTVTSATGLYDFSGLNHGTYDLSINAPGFQSYKKSGLVLNVAQTLRADAQLTVGVASQTVTVQANALQVQSETNEVSSLISNKQISQLSTNGRNVIALTALGSGVSNNNPSFNGVTAQGSSFNLSFNGMRPDHNNWLIDGGEVYDRGSGGKIGVLPSPDAIAEFQTLSSNYSADYGISSGGTITMVLKSGTQKYHGSLWEFNRNDIFDANNYFSKQANQKIPELRLNIFGGNLGGQVPLLKKTFFFVNEEWRKFIQGANPNATITIPGSNFPVAGQDLQYVDYTRTDATGQSTAVLPVVPQTKNPALLAQYAALGLTPGQPFPYTCSAPNSCVSTIPHQLFDPNAVLFMGTGAIPRPNLGTNQWVASPKQPTDVREDVVRIDHDLTDKLHLMGHWIHDDMSQTIFPSMWSSDSYDTVGNVFKNPSWGAVVKLSQMISPTLLNVNGNTIDITPTGIYKQPSGWSATGIFTGNNAGNRLPSVSFNGVGPGTTWTTNYWPWHNSFLNYQFRDDLSWTKGAHSLKFGFSYMRMDKNQQVQADTQGDYTFNDSAFSGDSYVNFLLGFASSYTQLQNQWTAHWLNNTYSGYAMDNWHVLPRLTLNLGVRYDGLPHVYEKNNRTSNFVPVDFNLANAQVPASDGTLNPSGPGFSQPSGAPVPYYLNGVHLACVNGFPRGLVHNSYGTIQPRVGFAYDLFGNGKTVIRSGFGLFFERIQGNDIYGTDTNPPFAFQPSVSSVTFSNPNVTKDGAVAKTPTSPSNFNALAMNYDNPGTTQFSLGVQQELAPSVVFAVQYVGMTGWHQDDQRNINTLPLSDSSGYAHRQAVANGANANLYRQFPGWANITLNENETNSNYHSLQSVLRMENKHGLTLQFAYTYSHEIDIKSGDLQGVSNPFNLEYDRGSGTLDRRHIFNASYIYELPFFLHSNSALARTVLGGWQISGITVAESGVPAGPSYGTDVLGLGGGSNRPNLSGHVSYPKKPTAWFNTAAFSAPVAPWVSGSTGPNAGFGNSGKDAVVGPGLFNWNLSLFKEVRITSAEGPRIQLRAESYNTFNHTEFQNVSTGFTNSNFGQLTSTYDPRVLQFGAKFLF